MFFKIEKKNHLLLVAFLLPLSLNLLQFIASNYGAELLPAYIFSDAALFHYSAWFKATLGVDSYTSRIIALSPFESLLSASIKLFGYSNHVPFLLNALLSACACVFIAMTALEVFNRRAAMLSIVMYSFCAPILFFSGLPHKTTLVVLFLSVANFLVVRFYITKAWYYLIGFTVILMIAYIDRVHVLTVLIVLFGVLLFSHSKGESRRPYLIGAAVMTFVLLATNAVSSKYYGAEPRYFSSVGLNIYIGHTKPDNFLLEVDGIKNHMLGHRTDPRKVAEKALNKPLSQAQVTAYWVTNTLEYIVENPAEYLHGQVQKVHHLFAQISTSLLSESVGVWRFHRSVMQFAIFDFASVFALFCVAAIILWRHSSYTPITAYLLLGGVSYLLTSMLTIVLERYRVGTFVFMIPLASFALANITERWRDHIQEICLAVTVFVISHVLMVTAPGAYADETSIANARKSAANKASAVKPFYSSRAALDRDVTRANCEVFIGHLKKVGHKLDINRAKIGCSKIISRKGLENR